MPIKIPQELPAREILTNENIFVMDEVRAVHQDIRPMQILILNLMPTKITTETQLLRLLGNTPLQIETDLLRVSTHESKNTPESHLMAFYKTFEQIKMHYYDAMIITGAPVEQLPFEEVDYWEELKEIMDWSLTHTFSLLYICWGAQAALYHHFGVPKFPPARQAVRRISATTSFRRMYSCCAALTTSSTRPHSRHTEVRRADIEANPKTGSPGRIGTGRRIHRRHARRPPDFHHRPFRIRPAHPAGRIPARPESRLAHPGAPELLSQ